VWLAAVAGAGCSAATSFGRRVLLPIAVPFFFLWAVGFSYELRTIAILLPFLALAAGAGLTQAGQVMRNAGQWLLERFRRLGMPRWSEIAAGLLLAGLAGIVLFVPLQPDEFRTPFVRWAQGVRYSAWAQGEHTWWYCFLAAALLLTLLRYARFAVRVRIPNIVVLACCGAAGFVLCANAPAAGKLISRQIELERSAGFKPLNVKLYEVMATEPPQTMIAGDYWILGYLPELKRRYWELRLPGGFSYDWIHSWLAAHPRVGILVFGEEEWPDATRSKMLADGARVVSRESGFCIVVLSRDAGRAE
jgi:hypothetical protein